jgi:hypothetical protein
MPVRNAHAFNSSIIKFASFAFNFLNLKMNDVLTLNVLFLGDILILDVVLIAGQFFDVAVA